MTDKYSKMKNGTLMVPLRSVMERLGADVIWNGEKYRVIVHYMGKDVVIPPGKRSVTIGQSVYPLTEATVLVDGTVWTELQLLETAFQLKIFSRPVFTMTSKTWMRPAIGPLTDPAFQPDYRVIPSRGNSFYPPPQGCRRMPLERLCASP
ncbi:copper amine oxidase N-terminal domain-containing protein [Thermicanus aegyptius]|uniref:copper amine oxidase N-terminal domain-containing protein n=1 Tax=Thermicanus aegyptius TaxID=94009 RepID=UPI00048BF0B9|nr:copper amine oxidase N-terminal domain-containing protein [Thermicanus aegyptius]